MNKKTNDNFGYTLGLWAGTLIGIGLLVLILLIVIVGIKYFVGLL